MKPARSTSIAFALFALLGAATAVAAQGFEGVALGPDGAPLAGVPVAVHRVSDDGGNTAATSTTADDGTFRFDVAMADSSALYFGAIIYDGAVYLGPGVRGGQGPIADYVVRVSPETEAGAVAAALAGGDAGAAEAGAGDMGGAGGVGGIGQAPEAGDGATGAALLLGLLALTTAAVFVVAAPGYRRRRTRDDLIEIAALENRLESEPPGPEREAAERKVKELKERLLPEG